MVKLLGAALVAGGCAWLGFRRALELKDRVRALEQMAGGLALVERELALGAPPLPRLLEGAAGRCAGPAAELFAGCAQALARPDREGFPALWRGQVARLEAMGEEGREALGPLGEILGRYDCREQRAGLAAVRGRLEELSALARADSRRRGRVYEALGLSGGAFLVVLLL